MEQCAKLVIRPPRARYDVNLDLLDQEFMLKSKWFQRKDIKIRNCRGEVLECSHYVPRNSATNKPLPCVIYCHGNSGSRVDANEAALILLPSRITVFTFDFSGSGLSDGDHVTLGLNEKLDLKTIVNYLREDMNVSRIGLWGRSMGAVASLMYGAEDPSIAGMILDSPFSNLFEIMTDLVGAYNISVVKYGVNSFIKKMRQCILRKANFDIMDLNTIKAAKLCHVPALLGHAISDNLVRPLHSDRIFKAYAGEKKIIKFNGGHNSPRPLCYLEAAGKFFYKIFSDVCCDYSMTKAQADIAGTSLVPCFAISELSKYNWFEPKDPSLLAKHYFENPRIDSPDTAGTAESDERMYVEAVMESLNDLEMREEDVVPRPSPTVGTISLETSRKDKLGDFSHLIAHSGIITSSSSIQDRHLCHNPYEETIPWLMTSPSNTASKLEPGSFLESACGDISSTDMVNNTRDVRTTVIPNPINHIMDGLMRRRDPNLFQSHNHDARQLHECRHS